MKNTIKLFSYLFLTALLVSSCQESDNVIDQVIDGQTTGGVLRNISVNSSVLNSSEPDSFFSVTVEEQDEQFGGLFKSISVYGTFNDLTPENGTYVAESVFVKEIDASTFTETSDNGLPMGDVVATYGEIASALGLTASNVLPGDVVKIQLRLNLTDGRVFTDENSGVNVIGSAYFASPFSYTALVLCSPMPGDYLVVMNDAYGDGWQTTNGNGGPGLIINIDDTEVQVGICTIWETPSYACTPGNGTPGSVPDTGVEATVTVPAGTQVLTWELPGDSWGEISFDIYGPNGDLIYSRPIGGDTGVLPVTLCAQ